MTADTAKSGLILCRPIGFAYGNIMAENRFICGNLFICGLRAAEYYQFSLFSGWRSLGRGANMGYLIERSGSFGIFTSAPFNS